MGAVELFLFYLLAAAAPLSLASINIAQGGLSLFFLARVARRKVLFGAPQWALLAFFAWNAVAAALGPNPRVSIIGVLDFWSWSPFFIAGALPSAVRIKASRFASFLALSACATVPMDLAQFFLGTDFNHGHKLFGRGPVGTVNAYGFFSHHLTYAGMLSLALALTVGMALYGVGRKRGWWLASAAMGAGLVTTLARSYLLAAIPAMVVLLWRRGRRWLLSGAVGAAVVGAVLLLAGPQKIRDRAASLWDLNHPSNAERVYLWASALDMIRERPVLGWGPGKVYAEMSGSYRIPYADRIRYPDGKGGFKVGFRTTAHCHDLYLMILVHSGAVGLALFLLFLTLAFRDLLRQQDLPLRYGVMAAWVAFLVGGLFEFNGGDAEVATLAFFLLGLACRGTLLEGAVAGGCPEVAGAEHPA